MERGTTKGSGWITFAGVAVLVAGAYNALGGIAALSDDDTVAANVQEVLYGIDLTAWGWFWLAIGLAQLVTGVLILGRNSLGFLLGVTGASISAIMTVFRHLHIPAVGDRGPRARLPGAVRAVYPERRVRAVTLGM